VNNVGDMSQDSASVCVFSHQKLSTSNSFQLGGKKKRGIKKRRENFLMLHLNKIKEIMQRWEERKSISKGRTAYFIALTGFVVYCFFYFCHIVPTHRFIAGS